MDPITTGSAAFLPPLESTENSALAGRVSGEEGSDFLEEFIRMLFSEPEGADYDSGAAEKEQGPGEIRARAARLLEPGSFRHTVPGVAGEEEEVGRTEQPEGSAHLEAADNVAPEGPNLSLLFSLQDKPAVSEPGQPKVTRELSPVVLEGGPDHSRTRRFESITRSAKGPRPGEPAPPLTDHSLIFETPAARGELVLGTYSDKSFHGAKAGIEAHLESGTESSPAPLAFRPDDQAQRLDFQQHTIQREGEASGLAALKETEGFLKPLEFKLQVEIETQAHSNSGRDQLPFGLQGKGEAALLSQPQSPLPESLPTEALSEQNLRMLFSEFVQRARLLRSDEKISFDVQLKPEILGRLRIETTMNADHSLRALIHVQDPEVKRALESNLNGLRRLLQEAGLQIRALEVHSASVQDQTGSGFSGEHFGGETPRQNRSQQQSPAETLRYLEKRPTEEETGSSRRPGGDGLIHYYA